MTHRRSRRLALAAAAAGLVVLSACGAPAEQEPAAAAQEHGEHQEHGQHEGEHDAQEAPQQHQHHGGGALQLWATQTPSLGTITLDGAGRIVYGSFADGNNPPVSNCTGECAQRWVPLILPEGQEPDLLGLDPDRVGTLRREDGALQVTLAGWPLYTVAGDQGAHDGTGSHGAEGTWFAITPTGESATP